MFHQSALRGVTAITRRTGVYHPRRPTGRRILANGGASNPKWRVGVDIMPITFGISGGVEVYMRMLIQTLQQSEEVTVVALCLASQLAKLRSLFNDQIEYFVYDELPSRTYIRRLNKLIGRKSQSQGLGETPVSFAFLREDANIDILHSPVQGFSAYDFTLPSVFHLHDLQHIHLPENFTAGDISARNHIYAQAADLAGSIIVSTDFAKQDIITHLGVTPSKIHRVRAAIDPLVEGGLATFGEKDARAQYKLPETFGFFPAQFWRHKNHSRLVEALSLVHKHARHKDFRLVFSGSRQHTGWPVVRETIERLGLEDHVQMLDYVPVGHLAGIYKAATFCVVPTLFEASSYPVMEAQSLGCPAMCSNVTALPELMVGGAGVLFDPHSPEDMAEKMIHWLNHPEEAQACAAIAAVKVRKEHNVPSFLSGVMDVYNTLAPR